MLSAPPCPGLPSCFPFPVIPGAPDGATVLSPCLSLQLLWLPAQGSEPSGYGSVSSGPWGPCLQWHTGVMNQTDGDVWGFSTWPQWHQIELIFPRSPVVTVTCKEDMLQRNRATISCAQFKDSKSESSPFLLFFIMA